MTEAAPAPQALGSVADEIMGAILERNEAAGETSSIVASPAPVTRPSTPGFEDPLDEALFSDEALKDPATLQARARLLREQVKEAQKIRSAAHNARAEAERKLDKFKSTKSSVLAEKGAVQSQAALINSALADLQSGDPTRFIAAVERLGNVKDGNEYWRKVATSLATGKRIEEPAPSKELLELKAEIDQLKQAKLQELEQQTEAQVDAQLRAVRVQQLETAKTYNDLPLISGLAETEPNLVDARLCAVRQEHFEKTGHPLDLRAACDIVEGEIRSHFELLQRANGPRGVPTGERGAATPAVGQAGKPEQIANPATVQSSPKQQSTPITLPSSLSSEPAATKRGLTEAEQRQATIEALERAGLFANFGL